VEALLLDGQSTRAIAEQLGPRFSVSARTLHNDIKRVKRRWAREDARHISSRRAACIRRVERIAIEAHRAGDRTNAIRAETTLGRWLGLDAIAVHVRAELARAEEHSSFVPLVPLTQNDVLPDGTDAGIEWAPAWRMRPPGLARLQDPRSNGTTDD